MTYRAAIFAAVIAVSTPAVAGDQMDVFQEAATITVANERCGGVFPKDLSNTMILAVSMKTGTNVFDNSRTVSQIADKIRETVTPDRQAEFCTWVKAAAASMPKG